jgi:membrane-bound inhibitor of C-type lysozyme
MKRKLASLMFIVTSIGTAYAGGVSSTPNILNSIDDNSIEYLLTDERSVTRGEVFSGCGARSRAEEWCEGRGVCWVKGTSWLATAVDPKWTGRVETRSY